MTSFQAAADRAFKENRGKPTFNDHAVIEMPDNICDIAVAYAKTFLGVPYRWGGEHPSAGYDCSGFLQEILASVGLDPPGDQTAQSLYYALLSQCHGLESPQAGAILFFGKSLEKIGHVAFAISGYHMIEAAGGNHKTTTLEVAVSQKAFVKIRPIVSRKDLVARLLPKLFD